MKKGANVYASKYSGDTLTLSWNDCVDMVLHCSAAAAAVVVDIV
jgi:hypothetical protein